MVSFVSRRYERHNGIQRLVVCLSEYVPLHIALLAFPVITYWINSAVDG